MVKNPPARAGDLGSILVQKDPLEKEMATHSSILAWIVPWTEELGRLQSMGSHRIKLRKKVTLYCEFKVNSHLFIHSLNKHLSDLFVSATTSAL